MSLSEREQRILSELERDLMASGPRVGWTAAMVAGLLAGIAVLAAGLVLGVLAMMIGGAALTQLSLFVFRVPGLFRGRRSGRGWPWRR